MQRAAIKGVAVSGLNFTAAKTNQHTRMKISFNIDYTAAFGEELVLNVASDGGSVQYRMSTADGRSWSAAISMHGTPPQHMDYFYSVDSSGREKRREWEGMPHRLHLPEEGCADVAVYDMWTDIPPAAHLYSSAYTECFVRRGAEPAAAAVPPKRAVRIVARAPQLLPGQRVVVSGVGEALGGWAVSRALPMREVRRGEWAADLAADDLQGHFLEFKLVAVAPDAEPVWEEGYNRMLPLPGNGDGAFLDVRFIGEAAFPMPEVRVAGTSVPVFSLRSEGSYGVGDFGDLEAFAGWVAQTGQAVLQLLPVNDTSTTGRWTDSYPYSCVSVFALHPIYADLRQLPQIEDPVLRGRYEALGAELNALPQMDYERVYAAKMECLRIIYAQERARVVKTAAFKDFFRESSGWLVPYARYCSLRDANGTADFSKWEGNEAWDENEREALESPRTKLYKDAEFHYYVQFVLSGQLSKAHAAARRLGVALKGDIPIGVSRHGCDAWATPRYFNMDGQAGAPPDEFSATGQNWGFPTYNWDEMIADGCRWWISRFRSMGRYFDAYRIDHVLGFFRIWEIPTEQSGGLLGQFSPALGMTREEIEAYGLHFQEDLFTRPFIADWCVDRIFGGKAEEVKAKYMRRLHDDILELLPEYGTERKIEAAFAGKDDDCSRRTADGLKELAAGVLFVRDRKDPHKFHPRICAHGGFMYEALYDSDKTVFNRIYDDYFYRRNSKFWYREAMRKLPPLIGATGMLACAEDLGMVPDCVAWVMDELRILSLELQNMPKAPGREFGRLQDNPYRSVCTISTHDTPTLRQWWDEDPERAARFYRSAMGGDGNPPHPLPGWLARDIVEANLQSPSMLCVLSIQDWMAIDENTRAEDPDSERINIPANPAHYWRYRLHLTIEQLKANKDFSENIAGLVKRSGRATANNANEI